MTRLVALLPVLLLLFTGCKEVDQQGNPIGAYPRGSWFGFVSQTWWGQVLLVVAMLLAYLLLLLVVRLIRRYQHRKFLPKT